MKSVVISVRELLNKAAQIANDNMAFVEISIIDESLDQDFLSPRFIHFEACSKNGVVKDYESIYSEPFFNV